MALLILWYTIFLFISVSNYSPVRIIFISEPYAKHTKFTTSIWAKKKANVLECYLCH